LFHITQNIRHRVFVEEQGIPSELEYDGNDENATHYILYCNDEPIGTARWRFTVKGIKLERFAILKEFRNRGVGKYLLESVLKDVLKEKHSIYLHAQNNAVNFYIRAGFKICGKAFVEAGIKHYKMTLET